MEIEGEMETEMEMNPPPPPLLRSASASRTPSIPISATTTSSKSPLARIIRPCRCRCRRMRSSSTRRRPGSTWESAGATVGPSTRSLLRFRLRRMSSVPAPLTPLLEFGTQGTSSRFVYVPTPHTRNVLAQVLMNALTEWNIETKISTITVDNCNTNDVASESAFSTGGRTVSDLRSKLNEDTIEALMCSQNWLKHHPAVVGSDLVADSASTFVGEEEE